MLIELDQLVSECPDPRSRQYIRESVLCYKAGAYRASVVACWIAVAFDFVDKIRELAASGDAMAQETIAKFDQARQQGDVGAALAFEKGLLIVARDKFEFISPIEFIDLERLVQDRNRCAHPSQVSDNEVFEASPELARLHIVNATRYVLAQPAAQGKQALERLRVELDSNFFPAKRKDMIVFLRAGPLARPRESLLRGYLSILLKRLLKELELDWEKRQRARDALFAIAEIHPQSWKKLLQELLATVIPTLQTDEQLAMAVDFIGSERGAELWAYVSHADRLRLTTFVENLPSAYIDKIEDFLRHKSLPFYSTALARIKRATQQEISNSPWFDTPSPVIDRMLENYERSHSFAEANEIGRDLRFALTDTTKPDDHLARLVRAATKNDQVRYSNQFPLLLKEFIQNKVTDKEAAKQMLKEIDLGELVD
jgi:hypothetical protein